MLDLIADMAATPEAQADPYVWAAALMGHFVIGLTLTAALSAALERWAGDWIDGTRALSWGIVTAGYAALWEGAVQHFGAGVVDALTDTLAVTLGGAVGLLAWARNGAGVALSLGALLAVLWRGVKR